MNLKPKKDHQTSELAKDKASLEQKIKALKESEERLQLVFEHLNEVIVVAQDEKVKYCNPRTIELTGYSMEEIYSMNFIEFIHPDDRGKVEEEYHARLTGNKPKNSYPVRILTKEGQEKVYDVAVSDGRTITDGRCKTPVGNTVDYEAATWYNTIGASELMAIWTDPDFDPDQKAFYYTRVLEIPTPRWVLYDKLRLGAEIPEEAELVAKERAYTSPIWYNPK